MIDKIHRVLSRLSYDERNVIALWYGVDGAVCPHTAGEIALLIGCDTDEVLALHESALRNVRGT